jgi:hypothetical protein
MSKLGGLERYQRPPQQPFMELANGKARVSRPRYGPPWAGSSGVRPTQGNPWVGRVLGLYGPLFTGRPIGPKGPINFY